MTGEGGGGVEAGEAGRAAFRVLFVCSGNTCRSPMAEAIARSGVRLQGLDWLHVESAGVMAGPESPASPGLVEEAARHGVGVDAHRSRPLTAELVAEAHLIVGMSVAHLMAVMDLSQDVPMALATHFLPPDDDRHGRDVDDPIGGGADAYERTWVLIEECVEAMLGQIQREPPEDADTKRDADTDLDSDSDPKDEIE